MSGDLRAGHGQRIPGDHRDVTLRHARHVDRPGNVGKGLFQYAGADLVGLAVAEEHVLVQRFGDSVRGEVLHNNSHENLLHETDIVLLDAGAENATGYCSDVTRAWPVSGHFSPEGREIYDIVLAAEM